MPHTSYRTLALMLSTVVATQGCVTTRSSRAVEELRSARTGAFPERTLTEPTASPYTPFEQHRRQGTGRYLSRDDIRRLNMQRLSDVLRTLPGVGVGRGPSAQLRLSSNGGGRDCPPEIWIDGTLTPSISVDDIPLADINGLEVYRGPAGVPPELLSGSSRGGCGTLAVWTRR